MRAAALVLLCASACLAQLDDNTITITATRTVTLQPDQAVVQVNLSTPPDIGIDDAVAALRGTGFTAADLTGVSTSFQRVGLGLEWSFRKAGPFSGLKDVLPTIIALQQTLQQGFDLTYFLNTQASQQAQDAPALCPVPTLLADVRAQAQQVASAAGARLGGVVSMSKGDVQQEAVGFSFLVLDPLTGVGLSTGIPVTSLLGLFRAGPPSPAPGCTLTVQFQLLH